MKTWKLSLAVLVVFMLAGMAAAADPTAVVSTPSLTPARDGHLRGLLLLPETNALSDLSSRQRHLCALLSQADALPDLPALQRHLRALLPQTDALSLHAPRPAGMLSVAYHSSEIAAVVSPAPTEQRTSLSSGRRLRCTSVKARGILALEVLPTFSTFTKKRS